MRSAAFVIYEGVCEQAMSMLEGSFDLCSSLQHLSDCRDTLSECVRGRV